ncbi:MAG: hypothetical protein GY849_16740, partial [Deltaproteobacteria bacterium]|nr:hypothetical protein [Deltaproteobacteria bacterium]
MSVDYIAGLSESQVNAYLANGMSIAIYDIDNNRVSYVWSKSDTGDVTFTQYMYNASDELAYTITGASRSDVETAAASLSGETITTVSETTLETLLTPEMSIAIYDTAAERVDYVWSKSIDNDLSCTQYLYTADGDLAYTITGATRLEITNALAALGTQTIADLSNAQIDAMLTDEMSIAIYDITNNRVSSVWSKNAEGTVTFTAYYYDGDDLTFTITGEEQSVVLATLANITTTVTDLSTLNATDVATLLADGMSIAVYDIAESRVDYVWSKSDEGDVNYTLYGYTNAGTLSYTISGETKLEVDTLSASLVGLNVRTITEGQIDTYLTAGLSIAVYDSEGSLVDHVWSRSESGEATYTKYVYNSDNELIYTVSGATRNSVNAAAISLSTRDVTALDNTTVESILSSGMSIAVYDLAEERVASVWSMTDTGDVSYTGYVYDGDDLTLTVTGANKSDVDGAIASLSTQDITTLDAIAIDELLTDDMSIAIYDVTNARVSEVWSKSDAGDVTFTQYMYTLDGDLSYTVSGENKLSVQSVIANLSSAGVISTLDENQITNILTDGMSIAIYDIAEERVASVWSKSVDGALTYTAYSYDTSGKLVATVTGETKLDVDSVSAQIGDGAGLGALLNSDIDTLLASGMSIAIYDTVNNRVDAVWSKSDEGDVSYTMYAYTTTGQLGYTVSGEIKSQVEGFRGVSVDYIAGLSESQVNAYLANGMSIAIYDIDNNRVSYVWSK